MRRASGWKRGGQVIAVAAVLAITAVVWVVMSVPSPRLRAILYSAPIPITMALVGSSSSSPGGQYLGVLLLVAFMYAVAILEPRIGRVPAVVLALSGYVAVAAAVHIWVATPSYVAFAVSALGLGGLQLWKCRQQTTANETPTQARPSLLEYAAVPLVTTSTWVLGGVLGPFVVTFPYSGVPTMLALRSGRMAFAANFATQAWLLLAFLGLFHLARLHFDLRGALAIAWGGFLITTVWVNRRALSAALWSGTRHP